MASGSSGQVLLSGLSLGPCLEADFLEARFFRFRLFFFAEVAVATGSGGDGEAEVAGATGLKRCNGISSSNRGLSSFKKILLF